MVIERARIPEFGKWTVENQEMQGFKLYSKDFNNLRQHRKLSTDGAKNHDKRFGNKAPTDAPAPPRNGKCSSEVSPNLPTFSEPAAILKMMNNEPLSKADIIAILCTDNAGAGSSELGDFKQQRDEDIETSMTEMHPLEESDSGTESHVEEVAKIHSTSTPPMPAFGEWLMEPYAPGKYTREFDSMKERRKMAKMQESSAKPSLPALTKDEVQAILMGIASARLEAEIKEAERRTGVRSPHLKIARLKSRRFSRKLKSGKSREVSKELCADNDERNENFMAREIEISGPLTKSANPCLGFHSKKRLKGKGKQLLVEVPSQVHGKAFSTNKAAKPPSFQKELRKFLRKMLL